MLIAIMFIKYIRVINLLWCILICKSYISYVFYTVTLSTL